MLVSVWGVSAESTSFDPDTAKICLVGFGCAGSLVLAAKSITATGGGR